MIRRSASVHSSAGLSLSPGTVQKRNVAVFAIGIKYYLREGLLPAGVATSATRAEYGQAHLRRLQLIRALVDIGEVPVAALRKILAVVDDQDASVHQMLGTVEYQLGPRPAVPDGDDPDWQAASQEVDDLIADMGWTVTPFAPARTLLALSLAALRRSGSAPPGAGLRAYAEAMAGLAATEVASLAPDPDSAPGPEPAPPVPGRPRRVPVSRWLSQRSSAWSCTSGLSWPCAAWPRKTPRPASSVE